MIYSKAYKTVEGKWANTKEYDLWAHMLQRCDKGGKYQIAHPTYDGCYAGDSFKDFQLFAGWCSNQIGFGLKGYQLDKDILIKENKIYSEITCVFVPQALNSFITIRKSSRGEHPLGVCWDNNASKYQSCVHTNGKKAHLGLFKTPEEAHQAYCTAKEAEAYRWYERLRDGEFVVDPRVIERMRTWKVNE